ncbi:MULTISPECIES: hypothetical protein [unclassified Salinibacterium]|uniref:hypothetical protein n=1 Tax=unclassified Salinibacterium TaxID=2632331 RepID=UPI001421B444|nr:MULTISPECIES: hypothetical protein [unclassified Salinibacterium]
MSEQPPAVPTTPASAQATGRNGLAVAAFVVAVGSYAVGIIAGLAAYGVLAAGDFEVYTASMTILSALRVIAAIVAIVVAIIALGRSGGRLMIGAALGISGVEILAIVSSILSSLVLDVI